MKKRCWAMVAGLGMIAGVVMGGDAVPAGKYVWTATSEEKAAIEAAVEDGARQVNRLIRSVARGRLRESTAPFQRLSFSRADGAVTMKRDDDTPISGAVDGTAFEWKRKDGKVFTVAQTLSTNVLTQTFTDSDKNARVNQYIFADDSALTLVITRKSSSLESPVSYRLTYTKAE